MTTISVLCLLLLLFCNVVNSAVKLGDMKDTDFHHMSDISSPKLRRKLVEEDSQPEVSNKAAVSNSAASKSSPAPAHAKKVGTPLHKKTQVLGEPSTKLPRVFILGVQKGGSSSMMWMMIMQPQLCSGERKEVRPSDFLLLASSGILFNYSLSYLYLCIISSLYL